MNRSSVPRGKQAVVLGVTLSRFVLAYLLILCFHDHAWLSVIIILLVAFTSDWVDGRLARRWQVVSAFGEFIDPLGDKAICLTALWLLVAQQHTLVLFVCTAFISLYDLTTTTLRLVSARRIGTTFGASRLAKYKTATLMGGLLCMYASFLIRPATVVVAPGLWNLGLVLLVATSIFAARSLWNYLRPFFASQAQAVYQQYASITAIDFAAWHSTYGVICLICDIEGTLLPWGDSEVSGAVRQALKRARRAGITKFALVTNISPSQEARVRTIARAVRADVYCIPRGLEQRKPSPHMVLAAMETLGVSPHETAIVGDKLLDVLAARRAHIRMTAWVSRLGSTDHPGDRLFYRPIEPLLKLFF